MPTHSIRFAAATIAGMVALSPFTPVSAAPMFNGEPLNADALDEVRGGQSPFAPLTAATLVRINDDGARGDLRQFGSVTRTQMDVWWGTVGGELIAQSVRATSDR